MIQTKTTCVERCYKIYVCGMSVYDPRTGKDLVFRSYADAERYQMINCDCPDDPDAVEIIERSVSRPASADLILDDYVLEA